MHCIYYTFWQILCLDLTSSAPKTPVMNWNTDRELRLFLDLTFALLPTLLTTSHDLNSLNSKCVEQFLNQVGGWYSGPNAAGGLGCDPAYHPGRLLEKTQASVRIEHSAFSAHTSARVHPLCFVSREVSCICGPLDLYVTLVISPWNLLRLGVECARLFSPLPRQMPPLWARGKETPQFSCHTHCAHWLVMGRAGEVRSRDSTAPLLKPHIQEPWLRQWCVTKLPQPALFLHPWLH